MFGAVLYGIVAAVGFAFGPLQATWFLATRGPFVEVDATAAQVVRGDPEDGRRKVAFVEKV